MGNGTFLNVWVTYVYGVYMCGAWRPYPKGERANGTNRLSARTVDGG